MSSYNIHSIDPEIENLTVEMALSLIGKLDLLLTKLNTFFNYLWCKKQEISTVEMTVRDELRIIDDPADCISDVDLDDLIYVEVSTI